MKKKIQKKIININLLFILKSNNKKKERERWILERKKWNWNGIEIKINDMKKQSEWVVFYWKWRGEGMFGSWRGYLECEANNHNKCRHSVKLSRSLQRSRPQRMPLRRKVQSIIISLNNSYRSNHNDQKQDVFLFNRLPKRALV